MRRWRNIQVMAAALGLWAFTDVPPTVEVGVVVRMHGGSGCPGSGGVQATLASPAELRIAVPAFSAADGPRPICRVTLGVNHPAGWQYRVQVVTAGLDGGSQVLTTLEVEAYFQGRLATGKTGEVLSGAGVKTLPELQGEWSDCQAGRDLNLGLSLRQGSLRLKSPLLLSLAWRRC